MRRMSERFDPRTALDIQKEFLWQDRAEALAVFLEGPARERFRIQVEYESTWEEHHLLKMTQEYPEWPLKANAFRVRRSIHDLIMAVDEGTYGRSDESPWEISERENMAVETAVPAHLAYATLRRTEKELPKDASPELIVQIAQQFAWSEESEEFFREQAAVFLSKIELDGDTYDVAMLRCSVMNELSTVLNAVRGMPLEGYEAGEGA